MSWLETALAKYGWILLGLTFGFSAKYSLQYKRGEPVKGGEIASDLLLLPMVALIAFTIVTRAGATNEAAALSAAFCAVSADRLVKYAIDRWWGVETTSAPIARSAAD